MVPMNKFRNKLLVEVLDSSSLEVLISAFDAFLEAVFSQIHVIRLNLGWLGEI